MLKRLNRSVQLCIPLFFAVSLLSLVGLLFVSTSPAEADIPIVLIDDFSIDQEVITAFGMGNTNATITTGVGILGGERDLEVGVLAGIAISAGVSAGVLDLSIDDGSDGEMWVIWDGVDGLPSPIDLDHTGLGGVDLTAGGQQNAIALVIDSADEVGNIAIDIYTDGGNSSTHALVTPIITSTTTYLFKFDDFIIQFGTGADLTNVGAVTLHINGTSLDMVIGNITTVNAIGGTLTDALIVDNGLMGVADAGDTIRYTAVISNPGDASNSVEAGVLFTAPPVTNTALVVGSVTTSQGTVTTGNTAGDTSVAIDVGSVADDSSVTITFDVLVDDPLPFDANEISAQGMISSTSLSGLPTDDPDDPTGNDDPTVTVANPPVLPTSLELSKTADPDPAIAGTTMTYTLVITNSTMTTTTGIVLTDTLPLSTTISSVDHVDDDNGPFGFGGGSSENIVWVDPRPSTTSDHEYLTLDNPLLQTGIFTSRVMDGNSSLPWETLSWVPSRPYGKALPDGGAAETAYDIGNVNMLSNSGLFHFDGGITTFTNTAGVGADGICPAAVGENCPVIIPADPSSGIFGIFASFNGVSETISISDTTPIERYAIEMWVSPNVTETTSFILRTDAPPTSTAVLTYSQMIGIENGYFVHTVLDDSGQYKSITSTTPVALGGRYHLVGVAESNGDLKLFVNGVEEARRSDLASLWDGGTHYRLGSSYGISSTASYYDGWLDELAIFGRTLSSGEVYDRYVRGSTLLGFQVRSCADPTCDFEPFIGPDGSPFTIFSEVENDGLGLPTAIISDVVPPNRYFQYQAVLATLDPNIAPQLQSVSITPDHPAIAASQGSCALGDGTFTCTIGTLAPSETATVTAQVNIHPSVLGPITNTAALSSTEGLTATVQTVSQVEAVADLYLVKHDYHDPVNVGGVLTYSIDVINAGPSTVLSPTITDTLPLPLVGHVITSGNGWMCTDGAVISCQISSLLPGTYENAIMITATAPITEGVITNTVEITSAVTPDPIGANNITTETTSILRLADLSISKDGYPDPVMPGETLTYTINITNHGPYTATNVVMTDTLPSGLTANEADTFGWTCSPQAGDELVCSLDSDLMPDGVATMTLTATAPISGFLDNGATVSSDTADPDLENNEDEAFTAVQRVSDLSIAKFANADTVLAGSPITYTLVVTNAGPVPAGVFTTTVSRHSSGPINLPILAGEANRYPANIHIGSVPGVIRNISVTLESVSHTFPKDMSVLLVGPMGQSVVLMSEAGGGADLNDVTLNFHADGVTLPANAPLTSTVVYRPTSYGLPVPFAAPAPMAPYGGGLSSFYGESPNGVWQLFVIDTVDSDGGSIDRWRLDITAATTDTARVIDTLPAGMEIISPTLPAGWDQAPDAAEGTLEFFATQFEVGQPVTFTLAATAPITPGVITNTAMITTTDLDPVVDNNQSIVTTTVDPLADLIITKTVSAPTASMGSMIAYTLTVENIGPGNASETVTVTDFIPPQLSNMTVTPNGWSCNSPIITPLVCTLDSLPLGVAPSIVVMGQLPNVLGSISNTATVTSSVADPVASNNSSTVSMTVTDVPITGLMVTSSSPDVLGNVTSLSASLITGTNVSYSWSLGDGTVLTGNPISHTYTTTGTYTVVVTASNSVSTVTATTTVEITEFYFVYLPVVFNQYALAPDLVVTDLTVSSNAVVIVIENQGARDVEAAFWVDFYLNPTQPPAQVNDIWQDSGGEGAVWGVEGSVIPLAPGGTITLTLNDQYYRSDLSGLTLPIPAGSTAYAQVDSANAGVVDGAVAENHELSGLPYNNISAAVTSTADVEPLADVGFVGERSSSISNLPPRPE